MEVSRIEEALVLATKALLSTLTLNQAAAIKTEFGEVVEQLSSCYRIEDINRSLAVRSAHENILKIKDILSMGDAISASNAGDIRTTTTSREQKPKCLPPELDVDLPGKLSQFGPRHDNDHALISDIRILPTLSEILYDGRRPDFLPPRHSHNSPSRHHETGILWLLDSQFRLLREDTSGLLRDSVRLILDNWDTLVHNPDWRSKRKILRDDSPTPVRIYFAVEIQRIRSDLIKGVEIELEFDQVHRARNLNLQKRKQWWRGSRGLREGGTILALIDGEKEEDVAVNFLLVSKREICAFDQNEHHSPSGIRHVRDLASNAKRAMITLRLASPTCKVELSNLVYLASKNRRLPSSSRPLILVEFPAVLYNSFEGVLQCLQSLHKDPSYIPFTTWLAPREYGSTLPRSPTIAYSDGEIIVPPPAYLLNSVAIDLSCIPTTTTHNNNTQQQHTTTTHNNNNSSSSSTSSTNSLTFSLSDDPHAVAMVSALRHEIALIQGPPGTGKSYVGIQIARCLLKNTDLLGLGQILCVCYTNHALDQFLHELLDSGVTNILRIGSRSQSPRLEALSLENYKKNEQIPRVKGLGKRIRDCRASLEELSAEIQNVCRQAEESSVEMVKRFLEKRFPEQMNVIFGGRSEIGRDNFDSGLEAAIETWHSGDAPGDFSNSLERTIDQLLLVGIWTLTKSERARLYQYWHDFAFAELSQNFYELVQRHSSAKQAYTSLFNTSDAQILDRFQIVGVTTTGLANQSYLLRDLHAKVLICEEAGEVLEAHILTALLPSIQHAILIGDHLQLRPRISNIKLSMEYDRAGPKYSLDESLFERLANSSFGGDWNMSGEEREEKGKFPIAQLDHQRRMHPTISTLVRETLYPLLRDHPDTAFYPGIPGMKRRLFWLDHRKTEDASDPGEPMQSKTNNWEAKMVTALVRHLCRQGKYKPGEIAVLTPYVGQLRILRDMLAEVVEPIIGERDLADLDAPEVEVGGRGSCGKREQPLQQIVRKGNLSDELRMATVDNFQGEEATVVIVSLVRSNRQRNCGFLKTPNRINVLLSRAKHGMYIIGDANTSSSVPMWSSIIQLLEKKGDIGPKLELHCSRHPSHRIYGGCAEKCGLRLSCGHSCAVKCMELCTRLKECGHLCSKKCNAPCGECAEKVQDVELPCGHRAKEVECRILENLAIVQCEQLVERRMPECGHSITIWCHESKKNIPCSHPCDNLLSCGHTCRKLCSIDDHGFCDTPCGRSFTTCSHTCSQLCHADTPCPPCDRPCEVQCRHSKCPKKCIDPCPPCAEICGWSCSHKRDRCNMPCAVPCEIIPCDHRCEKKLVPCGHQCPGLCGERCPDSKFCRICCAPDILERNVDFIMFEKYGEIEIDKDPLIFLSCGHFYTVSSIDGIMELTKHYVTDSQTSNIVRPKLLQRVVNSGSAPKGCPECRRPLRDVDRYNRIVKKALLDEATRRFVTQANSRCAELIEEIRNREMKVEDERTQFMLEWSQAIGELRDSDQVKNSLKAYQTEGTQLQKRVNKFTKSVEKTEQPFGRVNDIFACAVARQRDVTANAFELDESVIQTGFQFRGKCLSLRLDWVTLWDFDTIYNNDTIDSRIRSALRNAVATRIQGLIGKCLSLIESSRNGKFPLQEAEARIYQALFSMLSLSNSRAQGKSVDSATEMSTRLRASEGLQECESLCARYPGTLAYLKDDIEKARRVVNEEKQEVYRAMARQFSGTGHWYYCRNNHPFTVGECGMPMEEARCPQCEELIGGLDHTPSQGVRRAEDLEAEFGST
ncbi:hypothetical protein B0O99DRAFT_652786 [Bisporella sp. PMI_857]|nr:hypothetical protein B0O99DRAFT_652786 [Bisporella sp. PMI_857]